MKRAKIIVIEGTDGSGKETQSKLLESYYISKGYKVKRVAFPVYDSPTGKIVGGPYLGKTDICPSYFEESSPNVDPIVSSLYYAADRRYNFLKEIESYIYKNDILILDRYTTSNMGHQVGKATSKAKKDILLDFIYTLEFDLCELPKPDLVLFLHMPYKASIELRKGRTATDGNESSPTHMKKAEENYLYICKKYRWSYINCLNGKYKDIKSIRTIEDIHEEVIKITDKILKNKCNKINKMTRF